MRCILLLIFFAFSQIVYAQNVSDGLIDSLSNELNKASSDTEKVNLLNELSYTYLSANVNVSAKYAEQALELAKKINWSQGVATAYNRVGACLVVSKQYNKALDIFQKSLKILERDTLYTQTEKVLHNLVYTYLEIGMVDKAEIYNRRLLALANEHYSKKRISEIYKEIGDAYVSHDHYENALFYWGRSLSIADSIHDRSLLSSLLPNIALAYSYQNEHAQALYYYDRAISTTKNILDSSNQALYLMRSSYNLRSLGRYEEAINRLRNALNIYKQLADTYMTGVVYENSGMLYYTIGYYPMALDEYLKAISIGEKMMHRSSDLINAARNDITLLYRSMKEYDRALTYLYSSYKAYVRRNDKHSAATVLSNIGCVYQSKGDNDSALIILNDAVSIFEQLNDSLNKAITELNIAEVYATVSPSRAIFYFESALNVFKQVDDEKHEAKCELGIAQANLLKFYQDTISSDPVKEDTYVRPMIPQLKNAITICIKHNMLEELYVGYQLLSQCQKLTGDIGGAYSNYQNYILYRDSVINIDRAKSMTRSLLQYEFNKKEDSIRVQNEVRLALEQQEYESKLKVGSVVGVSLIILIFSSFYFYRRREKYRFDLQLVETKQQALNAQMSDHFIGNTMDSINHFIRANNKDKASEYLLLFSRLIRKVLENSQENLITVNEDIAVLTDYLELEKLRYIDGALSYSITIDEAISGNATLIPPMVFQTLAENSLKHGLEKKGGGKLSVEVKKVRSKLECTVKDNGVGRNKNTGTDRRSYGGSIAERLVKTVGKDIKETSFEVFDLFDDKNNPSGTMVRFTIPHIIAE